MIRPGLTRIVQGMLFSVGACMKAVATPPRLMLKQLGMLCLVRLTVLSIRATRCDPLCMSTMLFLPM